ncbi:mandelate racemase/muconate lactonizing enzyme family protein [Rhizobium sp. PAMB 3174]
MKITGLRSFMSCDRDRPRVLVAIDTDEGITGWGECYNHGPDRALPPLLDYLYLQIEGADPRRIEALVLKLLQQSRFPPGALGLAAISAIDHALWDISAKALNVPVYMLLGGNVRERVRVYQGVYTAPEPERIRDHCIEMRESYGLTAFKLSPYRIDIHANPWGKVLRTTGEWVEKVMEACGEDVEFAFDAHAKIYEPWQAVQLGNLLAEFNPLFYEEPIRPENFEAWGRLKSQLKVPLATGESLFSKFEFLRLMQVSGADIIQPDICVIGGLLEMRKIAAMAEAHYVSVAPHNPMGPLATAVNLHFAASQPNFKILEYRLPVGAAYHSDGMSGDERVGYVVDPYVPKDGYLELRPDRPGWGVEIDEEYLKTDRYVHWERKLPIRPDGSTAHC